MDSGQEARLAGLRRYWQLVREGKADSPHAIRKKKAAQGLVQAQAHTVLNMASISITSEYLAPESEILASAKPFDREVGIYFLICNHEIVYVGQSVCVYTRVGVHKREGKIAFDAMAYVACKQEDLDLLESLYILRYLPKHNGDAHVGGKATPVSLQQIYQMLRR